MYDKTLVIGLGLIGGSLCLALRRAGLIRQLMGYDNSAAIMKEAINSKIIDESPVNLKDAMNLVLGKKDLIIVAVPLTAYPEVLEVCHNVDTQATIMDVGSAKTNLLSSLRAIWNQVPTNFVGTHPIAGSEKNGLAAADAQLFTNRKLIIVPYKWTNPARVYSVAQLWETLGCDVSFMDWKTHDKIFSYTSHLPHLLAYSLVESLATHRYNEDFFTYAASGFRDFTRIAASDERMWTDIFMTNKDYLMIALSRFQRLLATIRSDVQLDKQENLISRLKKSRARRYAFNNTALPRNDHDYLCSPCSALQGEITVAADKSISHRAAILGSIAKGMTRITNFLWAQDTIATIECLRAMKIKITAEGENLLIKGNGLYGLRKPVHSLSCGNAGTTARLLCGLLSAQKFSSNLRGDSSLSSRPMERVIAPLQQMGAQIYAQQQRLPLLIFGNPKLTAIEYTTPVPSAQVKSAILIAALYAKGESSISEPALTRDHTERMMKNFGYKIKRINDHSLSIQGEGTLYGAEIKVPADISSAAFFIVAASITPDSRIMLKNIGVNARRIGVINILKLMGANIRLHNKRQYGSEPIADIEVCHAPLKGIDIPPEQVPLAIDELPVIMVAGACAQGTTRLTHARELRVKESDRIATMVKGLQKLSIQAQAMEDGAIITGGTLTAGTVDSYEDHRIAMSFAVAACRAQGEIRIKRCANVATSFPDFIVCAQTIGMSIQEFNGHNH